MKQYRRRFIQFNMLLVSFILLVIFVVLSVVTWHNQYRELEHTMHQVLMPLGMQTQTDRPDRKPDGDDSNAQPPALPAPDDFQKDPQTQGEPTRLRLDRTNLVTALYDSETDTVQIISGGDDTDADGITAAVRQIAAESKDFGRLKGAGLFFCRESRNHEMRVALADTGYLTARMARTLGGLALALLAALGLFFAVSVALSRRAAKPMEDALEMERQFVADVSHDLKTPITVILADNAIMEQNPESTVAQQMQWLESSDEAARNMRAMVDQMLSLAALEQGQKKPVLTGVNLSAAAEKSVLQLESVAFERGVLLESDIPEEVFVAATTEYAARICSSLLENALKYEPAGGSVTLKLEKGKKKTHLTVRNAGSFIDPQDLPHIFERFYRADKTRGETQGHGLGLPILKKITELCGATITAESSERAGTTFTVCFNNAQPAES